MKKTLLAVGCALLALGGMHSCQEAAPPAVDMQTIRIDTAGQIVPGDVPALSRFCYVKLETTENCRIDEIEKVIEFDGKLFVLGNPDAAKVFVFDREGKFLYRLPESPTVGGIRFPTDITIDEKKRSLLVINEYRKVFEYDLSGKYIGRREPLSERKFYIEAVDGGVLYYDPNIDSPLYQICFYTEKGDSIDYFKKEYRGNGVYLDPGMAKIDRKGVLASSSFCDTVFLFHAGGPLFAPRYVFDFGAQRANTYENLGKAIPAYFQTVQENHLFMGPTALNLLDEKLFFNISGQRPYYGIFDPKNGQTRLFTRLMPDLPNYYGRSGVNPNEMVYAYKMDWLTDYFLENEPATEQGRALKGLCTNPDDNPVIVFGSL
jgi:hypothetical protein